MLCESLAHTRAQDEKHTRLKGGACTDSTVGFAHALYESTANAFTSLNAWANARVDVFDNLSNKFAGELETAGISTQFVTNNLNITFDQTIA